MTEGEQDAAAPDPGPAALRHREAAPQERLAALTAERDALHDRLLRLAAEFDNWKKRARKEQVDAAAEARAQVLADTLEVVDNLERALTMHEVNAGTPEAGAAVEGVVKGIALVLDLVKTRLGRYGVRPIESEGRPFDPHAHEAISRIESGEVEPGTVLAELQRGYVMGDRLLRPARVAVAAAPTTKKEPEAP